MVDSSWEHRRVAIRPDQIPFLKRMANGIETNNLSTVVNYILDDYKFLRQQQTAKTELSISVTETEGDENARLPDIDLDDFMS